MGPLAAALVKDHRVVVPDLRGMGHSARPAQGYDKKTQAHDIAGVLDALGIESAALVTHDIGNMVGYALAAQYPARVSRFVVIDAPLPGVGPWDDIVEAMRSGTSRFTAPMRSGWWPAASASTSTASGTSSPPTRLASTRPRGPTTRRSIYAEPGAMHAGFEQFKAFDQDALDNRAFVEQGKLAMPVLAVGGEKSFGPTMATVMRAAASDVEEGVILGSGHWVMEENPKATIELVTGFLAR